MDANLSADGGSAITDTRDMAVTRHDFFRILPRAVGDNPYTTHADGATITVGNGSVNISLGPQQIRKIALMKVHWCRVEFTAQGLSAAEFKEFSEFFHRRYQRGGG